MQVKLYEGLYARYWSTIYRGLQKKKVVWLKGTTETKKKRKLYILGPRNTRVSKPNVLPKKQLNRVLKP